MVFLNKAIPPTHELLKAVRKTAKANEPVTKEQLQTWYGQLKLISKALDDRLFIVMSAQSKGWAFAKDLDFYREGIYGHFVISTT